jgi:hypothetical protein
VAGLVLGLLALLAGLGAGAALYWRRGSAKKALGSAPSAVVVMSPIALRGAEGSAHVGEEMAPRFAAGGTAV